MYYSILIITDSRDRRLRQFLENSSAVPKSTVIIEKAIGGATLETLHNCIKKEVSFINSQYPLKKQL